MKELPRRLWHIGGGLSLPIAGLLAPENIFLPSLISITIAFLIFEAIRLKFSQVNRHFITCFQALLREREASTLTASAYFLIAASIVFILCDTPIAAMALTFVAVGDPIAGIVGERRGKQKITPEKFRFSRELKSEHGLRAFFAEIASQGFDSRGDGEGQELGRQWCLSCGLPCGRCYSGCHHSPRIMGGCSWSNMCHFG